MKLRLFSAAMLLMTVSPLAAHDLWIEPARYRQAPGERLDLALLLGEGLRIEERRALEMQRVTRLERFGPGGRADLRSEPNPLLEEEGTHMIVMERVSARVDLGAEKFNAYLEEEGHTREALLRLERGESGKPGRERFTRHLKTFVRVGTEESGMAAEPAGIRLELVPAVDPTRLDEGEELSVTLLFEEKPLADVRVSVISRAGDVISPPATLRTDASGRARFTIARPGAHLVRATFLRRCAGCSGVDYESFWTAMTFEIE